MNRIAANGSVLAETIGGEALQAFDYIPARSVDEVVSLLSSDGDHVRILSGGTDLLVQLREGRRQARLLVDIKRVPEVNELIYDPIVGLRLGAAIPCYRICSNPAVVRAYPGLIDAVSLIGGAQIQGRATLGGNLCNASPAADSIPALIVHEAVCVIASPHGRREVPAESFCTAPGQTLLQRGEFLVSLHIPPPKPRFGAGYLRFTPRNEMDIAVVGAGAAVVLDESHTTIVSARIALGAVAPTPLFVPEAGAYLAGRRISAEAIAEAARIAQAAARPINDMRGTIAQRKHLLAVLTRRALERAIERART
jgi:carbon-monoxide dehydrogenase medium subunit